MRAVRVAITLELLERVLRLPNGMRIRGTRLPIADDTVTLLVEHPDFPDYASVADMPDEEPIIKPDGSWTFRNGRTYPPRVDAVLHDRLST